MRIIDILGDARNAANTEWGTALAGGLLDLESDLVILDVQATLIGFRQRNLEAAEEGIKWDFLLSLNQLQGFIKFCIHLLFPPIQHQ
jgi:hypothetical protein